jgi:hypothetical protein
MYTCLASIKAAAGLAVTSAFVTGQVAGMYIFRSFSRNCSAAVWRIWDVYPISRIPDPDFYPSRIPDPRSRIPDLRSRIQKQLQKRGVKKIVVIPFFIAINLTKL